MRLKPVLQYYALHWLVLVLARGHAVSSDDLLLVTDDFRHNYHVHEATYLSHATVLRAIINCSVFYVGL